MIKKSMYTSPFGNAGWHSNNRDKLIEDVKQFCTHHDYDGFVSALISPHAGYKYCGHICGHAFGATKHQSFEHIIIIGPSHHEYLKNRYCIPSAIEMTTEIGSSSINKSFLSKFKKDKRSTVNNIIFEKEHSIWMMLPFIHYLHPNATISPIIIGNLEKETTINIANIIQPELNETTLLIVSSDFTHYGKAFNYTPFLGHIPNEIFKLDEHALNLIKEKKNTEFWNWFHENETTICGRYAISILLECLTNQKIVSNQYFQSGELSSDWSHSVSYQSVVFGL